MNIFTSLIFWIVIIAVIAIIAIIGYIADKTDPKNKKEEKETGEVPEIIPTQSVDETWSEDAKPIDERQETVHTVPTLEDWSVMPETEEVETNLEINSEPEEKPMFADLDNNADAVIPEIPAQEPEPETLNLEEPEELTLDEPAQPEEPETTEISPELPTEPAEEQTEENIWE